MHPSFQILYSFLLLPSSVALPRATLSHLVIQPLVAPCLQALSRALFRPPSQVVLFILLSPEVAYAWTPAFSLNLFLLYKLTPHLDLSPLLNSPHR